MDRPLDEEQRKTAERIAERQKGILNGSILTNLSIYPETFHCYKPE